MCEDVKRTENILEIGGWQQHIPISELPNPYAWNGDSYLANNYYSCGGGYNLFITDEEADAVSERGENVTIGYFGN